MGAGPNGLAAALVLARAGFRVSVLERAAVAGGGTRTKALTLPGFHHDVCSAVHPLAVASPFFSRLPLARAGLTWIHPPVPLAHPLDGGRAVLLHRSVGATARGLGRDGPSWASLFHPLTRNFDALLADVLGGLRIPRNPLLLLRFGTLAGRSAKAAADLVFRTPEARALFAGCAAHSFLPLSTAPSAAYGILLAVAGHAVGWPFPRGGARAISDALVRLLEEAGGEVVTGVEVAGPSDLPEDGPVLLDLGPPAVLRIAGDLLSPGYRRALERYRYGPGVFKVDWALDAPIPWAAPGCREAGTVHLGGTFEEVARAEEAAFSGRAAERPFVLLSQPTLFDPTRAPAGRHVAWGYAHVPNGSKEDRTEAIEAQVERFAPGFRSRILARSVMGTAEMEAHNPNLVGGDVNGGLGSFRQLLFRPAPRLVPWATPHPRLFLCSASTPPGGGVHGMSGAHAAAAVLARWRTPGA